MIFMSFSSNMMGTTSGAGTTYPSTPTKFIPVVFGVHLAKSLVF